MNTTKKKKQEANFTNLPIDIIVEIFNYSDVYQQFVTYSSTCNFFRAYYSDKKLQNELLKKNNLFFPTIKNEELKTKWTSTPQRFYSFIFYPMNKTKNLIVELKQMLPDYYEVSPGDSVEYLRDLIENFVKCDKPNLENCDLPPEFQLFFTEIDIFYFGFYIRGYSFRKVPFTYIDDGFPEHYLDFAHIEDGEMGYAYDVHFYLSLQLDSFGKLFTNNCVHFSEIKNVKFHQLLEMIVDELKKCEKEKTEGNLADFIDKMDAMNFWCKFLSDNNL